jgi:hypothetical protein
MTGRAPSQTAGGSANPFRTTARDHLPDFNECFAGVRLADMYNGFSPAPPAASPLPRHVLLNATPGHRAATTPLRVHDSFAFDDPAGASLHSIPSSVEPSVDGDDVRASRPTPASQPPRQFTPEVPLNHGADWPHLGPAAQRYAATSAALSSVDDMLARIDLYDGIVGDFGYYRPRFNPVVPRPGDRRALAARATLARSSSFTSSSRISFGLY